MNSLLRLNQDYKHLFKIILIGDAGIGKSSLLMSLCDNNYMHNYISTIGVDFNVKIIKLKNEYIKLHIWDTAGQERFRSITSSYYKGSQGIIIAFDLTDATSFSNINNWLEEVKRHGSSSVIKLLIGTKVDLVYKRVIDYDKAKAYADQLGMSYIETSSKDSINVEKIFYQLANEIMNTIKKEAVIHNNDIIEVKTIKKTSCCTYL